MQRSRSFGVFMGLVLTCATGLTAAALENPGKAQSAGFGSLPVAAQGSISAKLGRDLPAYQVRPTSTGFEAQNAKKTLKADFTSEGVTLHAAGAVWGMALRRYGHNGYRGDLTSVHAAAPRASANRVEYRRGLLTEWYVNGPLGLEQGFTVRERPHSELLRSTNHGQQQTTDTSTLTIALALSGDLAVNKVERESKGLTLITTVGNPTLRYTGLSAHDANGNELRTWMEVRGAELLLKSDDAHARYPVVFDPVVQLAELTASDGASSDDLGASVAISGNTVVVGAPEGYPEVSGPGAIYVFVRPSNGWANMTQTAKLTASDGVTGDLLGSSVSIDGTTIAAGAPNAAIGTNQLQGAVYLFVEPAGGWVDMTETAKLTASDGAYQDSLGFSTSIGGNTVVAGAPGANSLLGAAYVFVKPPSGWVSVSQRAKLTASDGQADGELGWSVSVSGKTIAAGAPAIINTLFAGAAYVYVRPASGWANTTQTATLTASDGQPGDRLGYSVAINADTVVAGAPLATTFGQPGSEQGAAYVFVESSSGWTNATQSAKLTAGSGQVGDQLGRSVSISINAAVAGAWRANNLQGKVYVYLKPSTGWKSTSRSSAQLAASDGQSNNVFGGSVAINGSTLVPGAYGWNSDQGAAYVFGP